MEDNSKRVLMAVALSLLVIIAWQFFFAPKQPVQQAQNAETAQQAQKAVQAPAPLAPSELDAQQAYTPVTGETITITTPLYVAELNTHGAVLQRFELLHYKETIQPNSPNIDLVGAAAVGKAPLGLILNLDGKEVHTWNKGTWTASGGSKTLAPGESTTLTFTAVLNGMTVERHLTFSADNYLITEETGLTNTLGGTQTGNVAFTAAARSMTPEDNRYDPTRISYYSEQSGLEEQNNRNDLREEGVNYTGQTDWVAISSNYFLFALLPRTPESSFFGKVQDNIFRLAVASPATFEPGVTKTMKADYYVGPCERQLLAQVPGHLDKAVNFGWFDVLAKPLLWLLDFLYQYVHNYGIAIILLTVFIKLVFWPLSHKSYKSMNEMKKLQPMVQKLREKYGDDKQRLNQETMQLYKTYKVNPMGGCLPMVLQIPVFFGLYKALLGAIELRHAPFIAHLPFTDLVWLADLSAKDPYYITPIIMGATSFLQQKMTPAAGDPTQQKIMMFMPLVFTFIFLNFPAGLVVYWLVNNVLSIAQQWYIMRDSKPKAA